MKLGDSDSRRDEERLTSEGGAAGDAASASVDARRLHAIQAVLVQYGEHRRRLSNGDPVCLKWAGWAGLGEVCHYWRVLTEVEMDLGMS